MRWVKESRTNEERKRIYKALRECGVNYYLAHRMRDWTISHIILFLKANNYIHDKKYFNKILKEVKL